MRIKWLDFAKGFAIFFVLVAHISQDFELPFLSYVSFTFIMPLFFAVSGYLYHRNDTLKKYKILVYKKVSSFIIPYVFFTIVLILMRYIVKGISHVYKYLFVPYSYLWFLYALFIIFIFVGFEDLIHINFATQIVVAIILLTVQEYLPWQQGSLNINPIAAVCGYFLCFYIGYAFRKFNITRIFVLSPNYIIYLMFVLWLVLLFVQYSLDPHCDTNLFCYSDVFTKLTSIPLLFALFINMKHNKLFNYFAKYGKYTLVIYLFHYPFYGKIHDLMNKFNAFPIHFLSSIVTFIILMIIVWEFSIFVCFLAKKIRIIDFVFYPKKYINKMFIK